MFLISSHRTRRARLFAAWALGCSALLGSALFAASGTVAAPPTTAKPALKATPTPATTTQATTIKTVATKTVATKTVATQTAAPTPEMVALRERIEKAPQGVAGLHRTSSGAMRCEKCHGDKVMPDDNQTVVNRECASCHEGYEEVAKLTAKKLSNPALNVHASHLGPEVACTACHQGHQASQSYCENCHTNFSMPMPGNQPAPR